MEYRIIKNEEHNGLEIYFGEKPSEEIRAALKEIKFRWEAMTKIISSFNWNRSNSQVDYFDVNFYEEWKILAA